MRHIRTLITAACVAVSASALAQNVPCPGETLTFQLEGEYYGTKTWEHSTDGVTWAAVTVIENEPFVLQPEQSGWYRVRFHDEDCGIDYVSEAQRFAAHAIDLGDAITISIGGVVKNELGGPVSGATVRAGCGAGVSATTDHFGVFLLQGVTVYDGLAHVSVEKEGYFTGSRSFVPGENADQAISQVHITLLQKNMAGTVQSASGGQVTGEGVTIQFPANAFVQNGQAYNGPVSVYLNHINPTSDDLHNQMPGMLMGVQDDQPQLLYSYGMAGVELTDAAGNAVQLASGSSATVRFPVMSTQQADAPASIPLWWFDEDLGYWVEEGEAQRVGNEYIGQVAHFSWWNCDVPGNFVLLKGTVIDQSTGSVLIDAQVRLISSTMGTGTTYTNGLGEVTGLVPTNQVLTLQVWLPCGPFGTSALVHEEVVGPFIAESALMVLVDNVSLKFVMGQVVDCSSAPVESGYIWVNEQPMFSVEGAFGFTTCANSVALRAVDLLTVNVSELATFQLLADTVDVGDLVACTPLFGTVTDIDGNVYLTIDIGSQEWMMENLRTSAYNDGTPILNMTDDSGWGQLSSGAWCNYQNLPVHDITYGKLYNWYAIDNQNICPQGWHVPADADWATLGSYLGGTNIAGGKMKATYSWNAPNLGATNASGFTALAGGVRNLPSGDFVGFGQHGSWWSATSSSSTEARFQYVSYAGASIDSTEGPKRFGLAIRCVRD